ncbi:MAG: DNA-binding transcriptional regulator [Kiritimatiellae bacterium]|nr:DNA-binding transcriptional regulator [Kiritimatiellia bacterium]
MRKIGILIERQRAFGRQLCSGIVQHAQTCDAWSLTMLDWDDLTYTSRLKGFDGFIVRVINDEIAKTFAQTGKPLVDVFEGCASQPFVKVIQDATGISQFAARHFIQHHFTTFGFFGHEGMAYSDMRRLAFVECLRLHHMGCFIYNTPASAIRNFEYNVMTKEKYSADSEERSIAKWVRKLPKPVAVFCSHDLRAYQLIKVCREIGVAVPTEVAVLGVDDDELLCNFTDPTISSIDPNACGIGCKAAETLAALMDGADCPPLIRVKPTRLVERKSTAIFPLDPPWLSDALVFIRANVRKRLSALDVYRHVGRSHTVVNDAFRQVLGTTVSKEIANVRLREAHRLVTTTDLSMSEISERSGFASVQYFTRSFTAAHGICPSMLRDAT